MTPDNFEWVKKIICNHELYFAAPLSFNDPFDCRPSFNFEGTKTEIIKYYQRILRKYVPHLNREQIKREVSAQIEGWTKGNKNQEAVARMTEMHKKQITESIGVLSLSTVRDDILMWSHYADSHRGVCLEFDAHYPFFANAQEVNYFSQRPRINPFRNNPEEMLDASILSKSIQWKYEQEWRLIQYTNGPGKYFFPAEALTGVILGSQISPENAEKIKAWLASRKFSARLYEAAVCDSTFSLSITEI